MTAANDIWKLGPISSSGLTSSTTTAAHATGGSEMAVRSRITAVRNMLVMINARTAGTGAPARST
jgi:hypothetical protein